MSDRRNRPTNRWGCKPDGDVCVQHDRPLDCNHGCWEAVEHKCKWKKQAGWYSLKPAEKAIK